MFATTADLATLIDSNGPSILEILGATVALAFLWLPFVFVAYAIGRKRFGVRFFFALTTAETLAIALAKFLRPEVFG